MTPDDALHPVPVFSLEERDRRYALVRKKMREAGLAALICPHATGEWDNFQPATRYLSCVGGAGMATSLIFPLEGSPIAAIRDARRIDRARSGQRWVDRRARATEQQLGGILRGRTSRVGSGLRNCRRCRSGRRGS